MTPRRADAAMTSKGSKRSGARRPARRLTSYAGPPTFRRAMTCSTRTRRPAGLGPTESVAVLIPARHHIRGFGRSEGTRRQRRAVAEAPPGRGGRRCLSRPSIMTNYAECAAASTRTRLWSPTGFGPNGRVAVRIRADTIFRATDLGYRAGELPHGLSLRYGPSGRIHSHSKPSQKLTPVSFPASKRERTAVRARGAGGWKFNEGQVAAYTATRHGNAERIDQEVYAAGGFGAAGRQHSYLAPHGTTQAPP
jgi:hypothetical protein